ncbi:MAG: DUF308 domain-containing protein [Ruminococcus sp.]|nr:DUF308 domain-containing protein [Ruminococcus sp.]
MKFIKSDAYFTGILLIAAGFFIIFLPDLLSALLYIAGIAIIVFSVAKLIGGQRASADISKTVGEVLVGIAVLALPKLLSVGVPIIIGLCLLISGIGRLLRLLEIRKYGSVKAASVIASAVLIVLGLLFILMPGRMSHSFINIAGILFIAAGIAVILFSNRKNKNKSSYDDSVINVDGYSVRDDDYKRLR